MYKNKKKLFLIMFAALFCGFSLMASEFAADDLKSMIFRDEQGVWFIKSNDFDKAFAAMGYAIAEDRLWQLELYKRTGKGRLSELFGQDQLGVDIIMRTMGYSEDELLDAYDNLDARTKGMISSYVGGVNARISEIEQNPALLPFEFIAMGSVLGTTLMPEKWTNTDLMAWSATLLRNFDGETQATGQVDNAALIQELAAKFPFDYYNMFNDLRWVNDPMAKTMVIEGEDYGPLIASLIPTSLDDVKSATNKLREQLNEMKEKLKEINAYAKMGSYAVVVSGQKTVSGNPILYSGPQMGFATPSIVVEGSIEAPGYVVSGMTVPGIPGILVGRSPYHTWSMQVGHANTVDQYLEAPEGVSLHRVETVGIAGAPALQLPVYRSSHGPIVHPIPYNEADPGNVIVSWKYSQWGYELEVVRAIYLLGVAYNPAAFYKAASAVPVSLHICYADNWGNIAYAMTGKDPIRPEGLDTRLPLIGDGTQEWTGEYKPMTFSINPEQGYFGGWNSKATKDYDNNQYYSVPEFNYGIFHRGHMVDDYLSQDKRFTFEDVKFTANILAATDSFGNGGDTWKFVKDVFTEAVNLYPTEARRKALEIMKDYDGYFISGGPHNLAGAQVRSDAWVLQENWIIEVLRLVFEDELATFSMTWEDQTTAILFNTFLHDITKDSVIKNTYNWFGDTSGSGKPEDVDQLIVLALDNVLAQLGPAPWLFSRGEIVYTHDLLGPISTTPFASRSTYAQCVEMGWLGPIRIETFFPLGISGNISMDFTTGQPVFDKNFFSMKPYYDNFVHRPFPLFRWANCN